MHLWFGPNFRYFFDDERGNFRYRAPQGFIDLFAREQIRTVNNVAFGVADSFFISYTRIDGSHQNYFSHDGHYAVLKSWLFDEGLAHDRVSTEVSLGLKDAFFAFSNQGHRWRNVPEDAIDQYQASIRLDLFIRKRVKTIDLGYDGTFLGICMDSSWFWDTKNAYPSLDALDLQKRLPNTQFLTINPFAPDQHFIMFKDGTIHYSLPAEWAGDIAQLFQQYASQAVGADQPRHQSLPPWQYIQQVSGLSPVQNPPQYHSPGPTHYPFPPQPQFQVPSPPPDKKSSFWQRSSSSSSAHSVPPAYPTYSPPSYQAYSPPLAPGGQYPQQHSAPQNVTPSNVSPTSPTSPHTHSHSTASTAIHLTHNVYDSYNNLTNSNVSGSGSGGSPLDVNSAMKAVNNSVNTINNVANAGQQGVQIVSQIANAGQMVGQMVVPISGAAAACAVM